MPFRRARLPLVERSAFGHSGVVVHTTIGTKDHAMPTMKATGTKALARIREERRALAEREKLARDEAVLELGEVVFDAGAEEIAPADLRALLTAALAVGPAKSVELLRSASDAAKPASRRANGAGHTVDPAHATA